MKTVTKLSGEERRAAIIKAVRKLFAAKGFDGTTTRELAAAAGGSEALLFKHFPNKEALVEAILERGSPGSLPALTGKWRPDVHALMRVVYEQLSAHPALLPLRWERRVNSPEAKKTLALESQIFKAAGIDGRLALDAHRLLGSYVVGFVVAGMEARKSIPEEEWLSQFEIGLDIALDGIDARRRAPKLSRR